MLTRLLLALAFVFYALNVPEMLHAMDAHAHGHAHAEGHRHAHGSGPASQDADTLDLNHVHCFTCVHGLQVPDAVPSLAPLTGRLSPPYVPLSFVPPQPCASIFHPPA